MSFLVQHVRAGANQAYEFHRTLLRNPAKSLIVPFVAGCSIQLIVDNLPPETESYFGFWQPLLKISIAVAAIGLGYFFESSESSPSLSTLTAGTLEDTVSYLFRGTGWQVSPNARRLWNFSKATCFSFLFWSAIAVGRNLVEGFQNVAAGHQDDGLVGAFQNITHYLTQ